MEETDMKSLKHKPVRALATAVALVNAGFVSGYERNFVAGAQTVKVEVFQFDADLGPVAKRSY